jgi:hypothetical protein
VALRPRLAPLTAQACLPENWDNEQAVVATNALLRQYPDVGVPSKHDVCVCRQIRVAFVLLGKSTLTTAELAEFTHGHLTLLGKKLSPEILPRFCAGLAGRFAKLG